MRIAAFFLTAALAAAQDPSVFRAGTHIVEIPIFTTGANDKPVDDLRAGDLLLFDNNKPQTIASFEKLGIRGNLNSVGAAPVRPRPQYSVIVLDALNTGWASQIYAREAVVKTLDALPPGSRVAIFALGDSLRLLHDFSSDTASLRASIDRYDGERPFWGADNVADSLNPYAAQYSSAEIANRSQPDPESNAAFALEQRIFNTLDALTAIARIMRQAPGQKNLLWVSAAFPLTSHHQDVTRAVRILNGANLVLYAIDPRGVLPSFAAEANDDAMKEFTEPTGGRTFYNNNDVASLLSDAFDDSRAGYILTYSPRDYAEDGSYHDVRLKTARKGVTLRYRPGYFADAR
jgi:VWFA-related protein